MHLVIHLSCDNNGPRMVTNTPSVSSGHVPPLFSSPLPPFPAFLPVDLVLEHVGVKDVEAKAVDEVAKHDGKDGHAGAIEPRAGDAAEDEELVFPVGIPGEERRWGVGWENCQHAYENGVAQWPQYSHTHRVKLSTPNSIINKSTVSTNT